MDIRQHKLAWRWTDSRYAVLPEEVLAALHPIGEIEAKRFHELGLCCLGKDGLSSEFFSRIEGTEHLSSEAGSSWLLQQEPLSAKEVVLSWSPTVALKTTWAVFVENWQEFCYPSSDDLIVLPLAENWVLLYHHEEEFHFGRQRVDA